MSSESQSANSKVTPWIPTIVATIAAIGSLLTVIASWLLTERIRTDIQAQTLLLERMKVDIGSQTLALEKVKVDIAAAAQRTADAAVAIDRARLQLDERIAKSTQTLANRKVQIDERKSTTDEIKMTPDFARLANDLRPVLEINCKADVEFPTLYRVSCRFTNKGAHRAHVVPTAVTMVDRGTQLPIERALSAFENAYGNTMLSGTWGDNTYTIKLTEYGRTIKRPDLKFEFRASTDQVGVNVAKRLAKGTLTDDELSQLSTQTYTFTLPIQ